MAVATIPTTTTRIPSETIGRSVWRVGVTAALVAAAATELFTAAARALAVPMRAADPGAATAKAIPVGGVAMAVLMNAAVGLVLVGALVRWAKSPSRTFAAVAVTYTALSLLGPALAGHTHLATKLVLTGAHLIAAAMIIPPVTAALRLGRR